MGLVDIAKSFVKAAFPPKADYTVAGYGQNLNLSTLERLKGVNVLFTGFDSGKEHAVVRMTEFTAGYVESCGFVAIKRELH